MYRACDERLQRYVAVKLIVEPLAHDSAAVRRFRREAELSARLAHRHVAAVLDAGSRPREYIVMELVDGPDLASVPTASAAEAILQICDALEHAHGRGVIHGDVTPQNILIGPRDGAAKLIDFGQAVEGFDVHSDVEALAGIASRLLSIEAGRPASISELRAHAGPTQLRAA